ncbi:hypothetical protein SISNIDRAFT_420603, partial [Sistotremastrum niveocremeum HHB9708]
MTRYRCTPSSTPASPPDLPYISYDNGDLILQSSDNVEFRVHLAVMSLVAPLFRNDNMISLEGYTRVIYDDVEGTNVKGIVLCELPATVLGNILRSIYPGERPHFDSLNEIVTVLFAADKYDFKSVVRDLEILLVSSTYVSTEPLRLYSLSRKLRISR